ncbi:hypothetical protein L195_g032607 [Trifolium pratense]|uniref:Uncharacterized protein n=1 Tax=Trifolium pratense TaxID=57577 RepID=A0A2K3LDQ5_TRIPR|nr:hypothetical protein L195_g032607 [Trifolium pratense]
MPDPNTREHPNPLPSDDATSMPDHHTTNTLEPNYRSEKTTTNRQPQTSGRNSGRSNADDQAIVAPLKNIVTSEVFMVWKLREK